VHISAVIVVTETSPTARTNAARRQLLSPVNDNYFCR
jgi:hypothetical protein